MGFLAKVAKNVLFGGVAGLAGGLLGKKKKPAPQALGQVNRDDAAEEIEANDEIRRRKGAAADMITGTRGAEAVGGTGRLVLGS